MRTRMLLALAAALIVAGCGGAVAPDDGKVSAPSAESRPVVAAQPENRGKSGPAPAQPSAVAKPAAPTGPTTVDPNTPVASNPTTPATGPVPAAPATGSGATAPAAQPAQAPVQALSFTTVQKGAYSGVTERKAVLITDEAAWQANWQQLNARMVPVPAAPAVDFSQQAMLAVYLGEKNTGGYSVEVTGVELDGSTLRVQVKQTAPGPGAIVTQALTQPFHMVRLPKLPAGTKVEVSW